MRLVRPTLAVLCCCLALPAAAQQALTQRTQAHATPGGAAIGTINSGAKLSAGEQKGNDVRVVIDGWVDASRVGGKRDSFPASVGGKIPLHVRASASLKGAIIAELRPGVGFTTTGKDKTWTHIRRTLWIAASAFPKSALPAAKAAAPPAKNHAPAPKTAVPKPVASSAATVPKPTAPDAPDAAAEPVPAGAMSAPHGTKVFAAPGGAPTGDLAPGAIVEPIARDRGWVKVRIEGWVNEKELNPADSAFGSALTAADLRANPDAAKGKIVRWEVQILSLQTADPLRRDLAKDEPYLLARGPGSENALLYLTVPPSLLAEAKTIQPLTTMIITAKVRTGRSDPAGTPILDLRSIIKR